MTREAPGLRQTLPVWWRIGFLSFGGPAAQIALMHRVIVDEKGWLSEKQFLNALSFCMLLPGPEAMQLATYAGWRLQGQKGGLIAGLLFVLPGAVVILALSILYLLYGQTTLLSTIFLGIKATVLVIVLEALLRVARRSLKGPSHWIIASLAFAGLFFLNLPFPLIILVAGIYGFVIGSKETPSDSEAVFGQSHSLPQSLRTAFLWLSLWLLPVLILLLTIGGLYGDIALFFSKLATVTFGGAYAVLAYMAQDAVALQGWLSTPEMMDGLGLAETTPGPLILVTEFVGFLAGARADGGIDIGGGLIAAGITLWVTFAPCFLWVFVGAPYIDWLGSKPRLRAALAAISAAVVGVIFNLSLWFGLHVLFDDITRTTMGPVIFWLPDLTSLDPLVVAITFIAAVLLLWRHWSVPTTLALCAALGLAAGYL